MSLSLVEYLQGLTLLCVYAGGAAAGAYVVRARLLPDLAGPEARLAEVVVAIGVAVGIAVLLGVAGILARGALVASAVAVAGLALTVHIRAPARRASALLRPGEPVEPCATPRQPPGGPKRASALIAAAALIAVALVLAVWGARTLRIVDVGVATVDGLWFHGPIAAGFVARGSIVDLHFLDLEILAPTFYPAHAELLNAVGFLLFDGRDTVIPALGLASLVLALFAAGCFGRPFGAAPLTTIAAAAVLTTPALVLTQAGEPKNDVVALGLLLAAIALLVATSQRPAGLALSGLAAGLAVGTKLTVAAPVLALAVGVTAIAPPGRRVLAAATWAVPALAAGGVWFARNLAHTGSPLPMVGLGPLPSVPDPALAHTAHTVADYLGDAEVWGDWYLPGLSHALGPLWPAFLVLAATGLALGLSARGAPLLRMLALVGIASAVAYVFTPYSAGGAEGEPEAFRLNVRWLAPSLVIGLMLLPASPSLRGPRAQAVLAGLLLVLVAGTQLGRDLWPAVTARAGLAMLVAVIVVALGWAAVRRFAVPRPAAVAAVALAGVAFGLAAHPRAERFVANSYERNAEPAAWQPFGLADVLSWGREQEDQRIAVGGTIGSFYQYPLYGAKLSNHVQRIGREGERGSFAAIPSCEEWRRALNAGRYDYLVATPTVDIWDPFGPRDEREIEWARTDPGTTLIERGEYASVLRITRPLDPGGCGSER